jgi:hypothetical protein
MFYELINYLFNLCSPGGKAFLGLLLSRLNPRNINGGPAMPFQLEVTNISSNTYSWYGSSCELVN